MERIKIGQLGICHEHASGKINTLRGLPEVFEIVGVVDDRNTKSARFAGDDLKPYEGLKWMTEEELFRTSGLQAVTVETPNGDLVDAALRCAERGLAMQMDKPGGMELEKFGRLLKICRKKNLPFQMGYMFRSNPAMLWCLKAIRNGWLGDIYEIHADMNHNYGGDVYQKYLAALPGGILFNLGCHWIDWIVAAMGRPQNVVPFLKSTPDVSEGTVNNALAVLEYPHAVVTVRACSKASDGMRRRFRAAGTKGTVELSPVERFDGQPLTMELTLAEDNEDYSAGYHVVDLGIQSDRYRDQLLELAAIIRGEMKNPYTYEHDYLVQEVVLAASGVGKWEK